MDGFQKRWKVGENRTASNCEGHKKDTARSGRLPEGGNGAKVPGNERFANQIESLSAAEKAELLDTVWESLEADVARLTDAQRAELDYRIARHAQNPLDVITWEQVRAGLFKKP